MMTDPIADLLTRIRNASRAEHEKVDIPSSKLKVRIAEILKAEGFIKNFRLMEEKKPGTLRVYLKYGAGNEQVISGLVRVSRPGRRVYVGKDKIPSDPGRHGRGDPLHVPGRDDRPRGPQARPRRRSPRLRVVGSRPCLESEEADSGPAGREGARWTGAASCGSRARRASSRTRCPPASP